MSALLRNVVANIAGTGWVALVQVLVVPVYVGLLGIEGFAVIGFYVTLQATLRILELGLTPTVNRELATYAAEPEGGARARDFTRTFEMLYCLLGVVVAAGFWMTAPTLAERWFDRTNLPGDSLLASLRGMGVLAGLQWPLSFYQGGLLGLEKQPLLNAVKAGMTTILAVAGVFTLSLEASTTLFFWSQILVTVGYVVMLRVLLWRQLPAGMRGPRVVPALVVGIWHFAGSVSVITICSLLLTQADKILLSRMLSLEEYGYYMLVSVLATGLAVIHAPVFNALFPRFTALVARNLSAQVGQLFRLACQWIAVLTLPLAIVISMFAFEIMLLWTGDRELATVTAPLLSILIAGHALNGLMSPLYALQLAHGCTALPLALNVSMVAVQIPALLLAIRSYGSSGAAVVWVAINAAYVLAGSPLTHRRIFATGGAAWFTDLVRAVLPALFVAAGWRIWNTTAYGVFGTAFTVVGALGTATIAAAIASPGVRGSVLAFLVARRTPAPAP